MLSPELIQEEKRFLDALLKSCDTNKDRVKYLTALYVEVQRMVQVHEKNVLLRNEKSFLDALTWNETSKKRKNEDEPNFTDPKTKKRKKQKKEEKKKKKTKVKKEEEEEEEEKQVEEKQVEEKQEEGKEVEEKEIAQDDPSPDLPFVEVPPYEPTLQQESEAQKDDEASLSQDTPVFHEDVEAENTLLPLVSPCKESVSSKKVDDVETEETVKDSMEDKLFLSAEEAAMCTAMDANSLKNDFHAVNTLLDMKVEDRGGEDEEESAPSSPVKKKRGRPRKERPVSDEAEVPKRGRGRPRKPVVTPSEEPKRKRGRPKKS